MTMRLPIYLICFVFLFLIQTITGFFVHAGNPSKKWTNDQIADAIYLAEGGEKAKSPFGILSVKCEGYDHCRQICLNTIRNNRKRYEEWGHKKFDTYLQFLSSRYAPIGAENDPTNLNQYWLGNVKSFLEREAK